MVNKMWYGFLGAQDLFRRTCVNLPERIKVVADGKELELPPAVQGLIFLNIESYGGGVKLWDVDDDKEDEHHGYWGHDQFQSASMQDGMLEVVAVYGVVHLGQLQVGEKKEKTTQGRTTCITHIRSLSM